jgi:hypothetical protein
MAGPFFCVYCINPSSNALIFIRYKMPEFFEKSTLSGAGKHPDFQVTSCHHFDTTNVDFAYIESE